MKRIIFFGLVIALLFTFTACKKAADPKYFMEDIANILIETDDCDKAATDIKEYVNTNGDKWKVYVLDQLKKELIAERSQGKQLDKSDAKRILKSLYFPTDKSLEEKVNQTKCDKNIMDDVNVIIKSVLEETRDLWHP